MTDLAEPGTRTRGAASGAGVGGATGSPPARRIGRPRWRDTRLLVGIVLVLLSVIVGARLFSSAEADDKWLAVRSDLPAGHVLTAGDLQPMSARLTGANSRHYFRADSGGALAGRTLVRPVAAGTFLPQDALAYGTAPASRVVPLLVKAGRLPALQPGDRVDVYVLSRAPASGPNAASDRVVRVLTDVEFLSADSLPSGDWTVQLRTPPDVVAAALAASQSERVDVVRVDRDSTDSPGPAGPSEAPGFGG